MRNFLNFSNKPNEAKELWFKSCLFANETRLIRYAKSLVHNLEASKDIVQDSFLKLWQQDYEKMQGRETPWLFTTSRNLAYDYLRRKHRKDISQSEIELEIADPAPSAEDRVVGQSNETVLEDILKTLSPGQRDVLNLKFQQGLSYKEISAITGLSVSHVGVLIHNTVSKLKEKIKKAESEGGRYEN